MKPFARNLWWLALGTLIYAGVIMWLLERNDNEVLENRSICSQIVMSIWYCFGNIVGYGADFNTRTSPGRLFTASLYILGLILVASYTANLASQLTIAKSTGIISGIDDIKNGKIPFNRIGVIVQTAVEDYYLREISNGAPNYYRLYTDTEMYNSKSEGLIDASFMDSGTAEYVTNNIYCNLTLVGNDFNQDIFGIVISQEWIYAQDLDVTILSLRESGELDRLREKWFQRKICPDSVVQSDEIGVEAICGLFLVFGIASILSLLLFVWKKRHNVKSYFYKLMHKQEFPVETRAAEIRPSNESFERPQAPQHTSIDLCFF
ncbi:unnamed protein product [Rotaria sp. Silwood2]|nr:unnamed protein product [Rotaria sp. Silwood2]